MNEHYLNEYYLKFLSVCHMPGTVLARYYFFSNSQMIILRTRKINLQVISIINFKSRFMKALQPGHVKNLIFINT